MTVERSRTLGEEIANAATHGVGLLGALIGAPLLLATSQADARQRFACAVFVTTLVALYAISTLYHALPQGRAKRILQLVDHMAIYLLIAGTYTPFTLGVLRGTWGPALCSVVWTLALGGILFKSVWRLRFPHLSTALYLSMGWLAVLAIKPLAAVLPAAGLGLLLAGGLFYTGGVLFYVWERPRYSHMVWHLFVLGGSACHFLAVLWYAIPASA